MWFYWHPFQFSRSLSTRIKFILIARMLFAIWVVVVFFVICRDDRKINRNSNRRVVVAKRRSMRVRVRVNMWLACWTTRSVCTHAMEFHTGRNRSISLFASAKHYFVQVYWSNELWWRDSKRFKCMNALTFIWFYYTVGLAIGSCSCFDCSFFIYKRAVFVCVFLLVLSGLLIHSCTHSLAYSVIYCVCVCGAHIGDNTEKKIECSSRKCNGFFQCHCNFYSRLT